MDYLVVEFPAGKSNFTGEMAAELASLVESGTIRVLDLLMLHKDQRRHRRGVRDRRPRRGRADELVGLETEIAEILAAEDVVHLAEAMENGSIAGVVVWENRWAAPFASAARRAGGQLIASGRIPIQAIVASLEAEDAARVKEPDMPLRPARAARRGVIGAPVARTAAVVGTAAVVAHGVNRRQDRRESRRDRRQDRGPGR